MNIAIHVKDKKDRKFLKRVLGQFGYNTAAYERLSDVKEKLLIISVSRVNFWTKFILRIKKNLVYVIWVDIRNKDKNIREVYKRASGDLVLPVSGGDIRKAVRFMLLEYSKKVGKLKR